MMLAWLWIVCLNVVSAVCSEMLRRFSGSPRRGQLGGGPPRERRSYVVYGTENTGLMCGSFWEKTARGTGGGARAVLLMLSFGALLTCG